MFAQGIKIIESAAAMKETTERVRKYPRRKARTEAHWRRMDKKWRKRYGFKREACMYWMQNPLGLYPERFGRHGERVLIVHPSLMSQVRSALRT
jgi:hypothetical protein